MDLGLRGKRALVLGGSRGLGKAAAKALAAEGARVAICSRSAERLQAAAVEVGAEIFLPLDLAQPGSARRAVEEATRSLGGVDVLLVNTGGPPKAKFQEATQAQWRAEFESLWMGAIDSIQAALPAMRAQKWGRVLVVTSVAAKEPMPALTISNGFRAGLLGLVKSLAHEVAIDGVTVNALLPGFTRTERLVELGTTDAQIAAQVPAGRMGLPEEFGAAAAFLASQQAAYITGQALAIDGGWTRGL